MAQKPALGKGLASLLPGLPGLHQPPLPANSVASQIPAPESATQRTSGGAISAGPAIPAAPSADVGRDRHLGISLANIEEIQANQYQPRRGFDDMALQELSDSIKSNGIIQPLVVRRSGSGYELIAGERRLRAAKLAGLKQVPIVIRRTTDRESLELALVENIQRQDLNCVDEALAYFQLMQDFSLTQEEVAEKVGKDRATVANYLRLLRLPQIALDDLKSGTLSFGHGKALLSLEDNELRLQLREAILNQKLSVRQAEAEAETLKAQGPKPTDPESGNAAPRQESPLKARMENLSHELARALSTKVELRGSERRGKIVLHYHSRQELDRLIETLQN